MAPSGGGILVLLLLVPTHCFAQEIVHAPESTTVFLNQSAVFTCETTGGITSWRVNGTHRELLLPDIRRDLVVSEESTTPEGTAVHTLTIPARALYNGTRVQCVTGLFGGPIVESDNATLTIQGPLSAVGDLKVNAENASSVTISWSAPFSLDVTDIWYSVLIYNVTDENNPTAILCSDCINITETHYTFTPDYLSPCHVYNFSVIPLNGAGQGESSGNVTSETKFPEVEVEALNDSYREVAFSHEQVHTVSVYIDNNGTNGTVFTLPADGEYKATIKDPMACGTGKTKNFTTYDVQEPRAESTDDGKIVVNGTLIGNSPAQGCFVVIQCNFTTEITFIALKRNGTNLRLSGEISMPASNYTVYVHDLEKDGLPNIHPANLVPSSVKITDGEEKHKAPESLKNASISRNGSILNVTCTPDEQSASCVLVYRAYGNSTLNYAENFPVIVDLDPDVNYTFALFRRLNNNYTDERPFLSMFVQGKEDSLQPGTPERAENTSSVVAVIVGVLVPLIIFLVVVAVSIMAIMLRKKKSGKLVESVDRKASNTALLMGRIAEDGGMKNEESKEEESKYAGNKDGSKEESNDNGNRGPPTVESVMSLLWGVAGHWKEIAEGLEFDEDLIDEIDTNNDMNEGCLQVCVETWIFKLQPSWKKLSHALRDLEEVELARQALNKVKPVAPPTVPVPPPVHESQPESSSSECTSSGESEVVTGTQGNASLPADSNNDGNRGVEKLMVDEDPKPTVHPSPTLPGDEKVCYCFADMEEVSTVFYKAKSCYHLNVITTVFYNAKSYGKSIDACVVGLNLNEHSLNPADISPSVTEDQQMDGFRQRSVARSEPTSKPTEPQLDSSHPGYGGSYEVVNGVEGAKLLSDDKDGEKRGAKSTMPNDCSTLPVLNNFTVQGEKEYDKALAESTLTTKGKRHTFDTSMLMAHGAGSIIPENCFADENIGVLMVNNEGEEDSHLDPTGSWRQESADNSCTVQGDGSDVVPGGVEIIPLKCSDETEEQDTVRGLLGPANILPTLPHKDAGKYVYPPLGFKAKEGLNEKSSLLNPSSIEPSPVVVQPQPEEPTSLQSEIQSGCSSDRHQGRENDMATPLECQDNNQGEELAEVGSAPVLPPPDDRHRELL